MQREEISDDEKEKRFQAFKANYGQRGFGDDQIRMALEKHQYHGGDAGHDLRQSGPESDGPPPLEGEEDAPTVSPPTPAPDTVSPAPSPYTLPDPVRDEWMIVATIGTMNASDGSLVCVTPDPYTLNVSTASIAANVTIENEEDLKMWNDKIASFFPNPRPTRVAGQYDTDAICNKPETQAACYETVLMIGNVYVPMCQRQGYAQTQRNCSTFAEDFFTTQEGVKLVDCTFMGAHMPNQCQGVNQTLGIGARLPIIPYNLRVRLSPTSGQTPYLAGYEPFYSSSLWRRGVSAARQVFGTSTHESPTQFPLDPKLSLSALVEQDDHRLGAVPHEEDGKPEIALKLGDVLVVAVIGGTTPSERAYYEASAYGMSLTEKAQHFLRFGHAFVAVARNITTDAAQVSQSRSRQIGSELEATSVASQAGTVAGSLLSRAVAPVAAPTAQAAEAGSMRGGDGLQQISPSLGSAVQTSVKTTGGGSLLAGNLTGSPHTRAGPRHDGTMERVGLGLQAAGQQSLASQNVAPVVEASVKGVAESLQQSPGASRAVGDGTDNRVFGSAMQVDARRADWPALSNPKAPADGVAQAQPPEPPSGVVSGTAAIDPRFASMDARRALQHAHEAEARAVEARRAAMRALAATRGAQHDPYDVLSSSRVNASPFGVNVG